MLNDILLCVYSYGYASTDEDLAMVNTLHEHRSLDTSSVLTSWIATLVPLLNPAQF